MVLRPPSSIELLVLIIQHSHIAQRLVAERRELACRLQRGGALLEWKLEAVPALERSRSRCDLIRCQPALMAGKQHQAVFVV